VALPAGCAGGAADPPSDGGLDAVTGHDGGLTDTGSQADSAGMMGDSGASSDANSGQDTGQGDTGTTCTGGGDAGAGCYAITCNAGGVHTLQANRDRLVADLAKRKCTDSCTLWADLNQAERYIFLM